MGIGALNYQGVKSGIKLNDVIEDFKYAYKGQEIKAGDFVKYINGVAGITTKETVATGLGATTPEGPAYGVAIDEETVFVVYCGGDYKLNGIVVKISGGVITTGTDTALSTVSYSADRLVKPVLLPNGAVAVTYNPNSNNGVGIIVCTIEGLVPVVKSTLKVTSATRSGMFKSTTLIDENKLFIAHAYNTSYYLYGIVVTIGEDYSITYGTDTALYVSGQYTYYGTRLKTKTLEPNKVIIGHAEGNATGKLRLMAKVCNISGTTITYGTSTLLDNDNDSLDDMGYYGLEVLQSNKVAFVHSADAYYGMCVTLADINGNVVSLAKQQLITTNYSGAGQRVSCTLLKGNVLFIACNGLKLGSSTQGELGIVIVEIDIQNNIITQGVDTLVTNDGVVASAYTDCERINDDVVFVCYGSNSTHRDKMGRLFGIDYENLLVKTTIPAKKYEQQAILATEPPFDGIALSNGVGGDDTAHNEQVKIAKPNV